jgi:hypothetical protein
VLNQAGPQAPQRLCSHLLEAMLPQRREDDAALLAVRLLLPFTP